MVTARKDEEEKFLNMTINIFGWEITIRRTPKVPKVPEAPPLQVPVVEKRRLAPWRTIRVDGGTREDLLERIEKHEGGGKEDSWCRWVDNTVWKIIECPTFKHSDTSQKVHLVELSPRLLGFRAGKTTYRRNFMTDEFCAEWSRKNLEGQAITLCNDDDGVYLWLQHSQTLPEEKVWMAMRGFAQDPWIHILGVWCYVFTTHRVDTLVTEYEFSNKPMPLDQKIIFRLLEV